MSSGRTWSFDSSASRWPWTRSSIWTASSSPSSTGRERVRDGGVAAAGGGAARERRQVRERDVAGGERPRAREAQGLEAELVAADLEQAAVLGARLAVAERRRDAGPGLRDAERADGRLARLDEALVLVAPDDEVEPLGDHRLVDARVAAAARVAVLVEHEDGEVRRAVLRRGPEERHALLLPEAVQALVADVAQAVERDARGALAQEHGVELDGVGAVAAAEVVDESRDREDVERGERVDAAVARRVVVVPVDGEDRQRDGRVRVLEVDAPGREVRGLVAEDLERDGRVAQRVAPEESHRLVQRAPARLVVVEQVPGVEEAVRAALLGQEEHLLEGGEGVAPAHGVAVEVAKMAETAGARS